MREFYECHNNIVAPRKARTINIKKEDVFKEIDSLTYKYAETSTIEAPQVKNAVSSDSHENLDGHILARHVEMRDARLRQLISFALDDSIEQFGADNTLVLNPEYVYRLILSVSFKDSLLKALATYFHRYLVYGALYDWYAAGMGSNQAKVYEKDLADIEASITNMLHSDEIVKMPMQPFGPARRII